MYPATEATGSLVFNRAAVGAGIGARDHFTTHRFIERSFHVIGRARNVGWIGRSFAVDRAFVNDFALRIDNKHVRRVACIISATGFAFWVKQQRGLLGVPIFHHFLRLLGRHVPLKAGRAGIDRQPDDTFAGVFAL